MKASELMAGDIVNLGYRDLAIKVLGVDGKKGVVFVEVQDNFKLQISYDEEEVKPFPLSAEIIGNNIPFERNWDSTRNNPSGSVTEWRKDTPKAFIYVYDFRNGDGTFVVEICLRDAYDMKVRLILRYVHELQHALRLCGLNDLADNLKVE